jgi:hypothetical protein
MVYNLKDTSEDYRIVDKAAYIHHTKDRTPGWMATTEQCILGSFVIPGAKKKKA